MSKTLEQDPCASFEILIWMVARERFELPTRGFPFLVPKRIKHLKYVEKPPRRCPIFPGIRPLKPLMGGEWLDNIRRGKAYCRRGGPPRANVHLLRGVTLEA